MNKIEEHKPSMLERLAPKISVAHATVELAETNKLLSALIEAQLRSARAIEALCLHAFGVDITVVSAPEPEITNPLDPNLRDDDISDRDEWIATIELMEQEGYAVPADIYAKLGIEPPRKDDSPDESIGYESESSSRSDDDERSMVASEEPASARKPNL